MLMSAQLPLAVEAAEAPVEDEGAAFTMEEAVVGVAPVVLADEVDNRVWCSSSILMSILDGGRLMR